MPIYELLGGKYRDKIRAYFDIHGSTPNELADDAKKYVDKGFTALKTSPFNPDWRNMTWNQALRDARKRRSQIATPITPLTIRIKYSC